MLICVEECVVNIYSTFTTFRYASLFWPQVKLLPQHTTHAGKRIRDGSFRWQQILTSVQNNR